MSLARKLLLAAVALVAVILGARWVYRALASDQTQIRWRIESMVDGFNDCKSGRVLAGLATEFRDRSSGATREDVHGALVQLFFERVDSRTHEFQMRAELVTDELAIEVDAVEPASATAEVRVLVHERAGDGERLFWDAHVSGRLEKRDDGWQWVETTEVNHSDRRRRR